MYCEDILTSEDCDYPSSECGSCISPPSADCKSGTMYNETFSVGEDEDWHYSVCITFPYLQSSYRDFTVVLTLTSDQLTLDSPVVALVVLASMVCVPRGVLIPAGLILHLALPAMPSAQRIHSYVRTRALRISQCVEISPLPMETTIHR